MLLKVLLYLVAAALSGAAFKAQKRRDDEGGARAFLATARSCLHAIRARGRAAPAHAWRAFGWLAAAAIFVALAVLRLIDLDRLVRFAAADSSLYEGRRPIQLALVLGAVGAGSVLVAIVVYAARRTPRLAVSLSVAIALLAYVGVRAVSHHRVDRVINERLLGIYTNSWLEAFGVLVVAVAVWREISPRRGGDGGGGGALARRFRSGPGR